MKSHVRALLNEVASPTYLPTWPISTAQFDLEPPAELRLSFTTGPFWATTFVAPAWMLLTHPSEFPVWRRFHRWPEVFNLAPMRGMLGSIAIPDYRSDDVQ